MAAVPCETLRIELGGATHAFPVLSLVDRRKRTPKRKQWCLVRATELMLYDLNGRSTGRFAAHLQSISMEDGVLVADRAAVTAGTLLEAELASVLAAMRSVLDFEAARACRRASICPMQILAAALTEFGRNDCTSAILTAVNRMPKRWRMEIEAETHAAAGEVDLLLVEQLESEECDELADLGDLAHELLLTVLPYDAAEGDTQKISNTALAPVPAAVAAELQAYEEHRMAPFNRHREGAAVVTTTVESDKANCLRFLGFLKSRCEQDAPSVTLLAHARVGEWVQRWLEWLRTEHSLKSSTLAVYTNGIISVSAFALTLVDAPDACPTSELLNLRRQAEALSKQEKLYAPKSPHWLSWEDAQRAREACIAKYHAATGLHARRALLRDCLVLAFHTLQPPDRVGVVRRLRLGPGGSLYKKPGESRYTVDLSKLKHKTSRFYGPIVHTLSPLLQPWVETWERSIACEFVGDGPPFLFSMASDWQRGHSSSAWTQLVKACFSRHAGVACPPKLLRQSFCTHLRSAEGVDTELLESCAKAMKHQVATGGSDNYDKAAHDRLLQKAHEYCATVAAKYATAPPPESGGASSSGTAPPAPLGAPPPVVALPGTVEAVRAAEQPDGTVRYTARFEWHAAMAKGALLSFHVPPTGTTLKVAVPTERAPFDLHLGMPASVAVPRFALAELRVLPPAAPPAAPPASAPAADPAPAAAPPPAPAPAAAPAADHTGQLSSAADIARTHAQQARRAAEGRAPVESCTRPPVPDALEQLAALGWTLREAEGAGDCFPLSALAGHELPDPAEVRAPSPAALAVVQKLRDGSVDLLAGSAPIGGVAARAFRKADGLPQGENAAERAMKPWRALRYWLSRDKRRFAAFMFGCAAHLKRPVYVLERGEGGVLDPLKVYGERDGDGALRRTTDGATVLTWRALPWAELLAVLRAAPASPPPLSVVLFDGAEHFAPLLLDAAAAARAAAQQAQAAQAAAAQAAPKAAPAPEAGAPAPAAPAVAPIPLAAPLTAVHTPSAKAPMGKRLYTVTVPWDDERMYAGAVLRLRVPRLNAAASTPVPAKPAGGSFALQLALPDSVADAAVPVPEAHITSGPKPVLAAPLAPTPAAAALPTAPIVPGSVQPAAPNAAPAPAARKRKPSAPPPAPPEPAATPPPVPAAAPPPEAAPPAAKKARSTAPPADAKPPRAKPRPAKPRPAKPPCAKPPRAKPPPGKARPVQKKTQQPAQPAPPPLPAPPTRSGRVSQKRERWGDGEEHALAASKFRSAPPPPKPAVALELETAAPFAAGARVWARAWHAGAKQTFAGTVVAVRAAFPRLHVRFEADAQGNAHPLALPPIASAYLTAADVWARD